MPILLIEQNAADGPANADRGYVIETGEIVLEDDAKKLLGNDARPQGVPRRGITRAQGPHPH